MRPAGELSVSVRAVSCTDSNRKLRATRKRVQVTLSRPRSAYARVQGLVVWRT